ncbi:MAG: 50S ribosomal protein L1 [Deltaproteobacteria bacterium]|nr:MAG: 50S ribosomal protein L1 [Deltaproteobacteria bacterium]
MAKRGKKYLAAKKKIDPLKKYNLEEAVKLLKETAYSKFDETVDVAIRLGINPKQPEQMVRGAVALPHGLGKEVKVLVFAKGEKENEAKEAGADYVGAEDLIEKISSGWLEFDRAIATPDMMSAVSKIGKILGPRGLMPNPKSGTVTFEVGKAISEVKGGKAEFRVDKGGVLHMPAGKISFVTEKLSENISSLVDAVIKAKPVSSKGTYLKSIVLSTTMGPGIKIEPTSFQAVSK